MTALRFLWLAYGAYKRAVDTGNPVYVSLMRRGVPFVSIYLATGREAWRISQTAVENWK